jgi:hypothetical protein
MRAHLIVLSSITTLLLLGGDLFAGEAEEKVMASCLVTNSATPAAYAACVAAGVTKNEVQKCITTPQQCYGPNNELRKLFCAVGIGSGCAGPQQAQLIRVFPFHGGCEVIYNTGIYFSPDCQNLRGGGNTINAWQAPQAHWSFVRAMTVFHDCIYTAFNSAIYRSCDGVNLGGGGNTVKLYEGAPVESMQVTTVNGNEVLRTKFRNNPYYCDPSGDHPGGGPGVWHC